MNKLLWLIYLLIRNYICDTFALLFISANQPRTDKKEIILVKLMALGDFILWLDTAKHLRQLYPQEQYRLVLLGNTIWTDLSQQLPYFDEVISVDKPRFIFDFRYRFRILRQLRKRQWAGAICTDYSREFMCGDAIVRVCAAAESIGFKGDFANQHNLLKQISDRWFTRLIPSNGEALTEWERNAEFMRGLGVRDVKHSLPKLDISAVLPSGFVLKDYYIVAPGAGDSIRQWPLEAFAELINRINSVSGIRPVICGAANEVELGQRLRQLVPFDVEDWSGKTTIKELVAITSGARFTLSNESGIIHIAAAVGTPVFCVAGGGHWGRFVPYPAEQLAVGQLHVSISHPMDCFGCNWKCRFEVADNMPVKCIQNVSVDSVWNEINSSGILAH